MTLTKLDFLRDARIDRETLELWIEAEWIVPATDADAEAFSKQDLARVDLIRDLTRDLGVNDEGVSVILHLLDQLHGLRRALAASLGTPR